MPENAQSGNPEGTPQKLKFNILGEEVEYDVPTTPEELDDLARSLGEKVEEKGKSIQADATRKYQEAKRLREELDQKMAEMNEKVEELALKKLEEWGVKPGSETTEEEIYDEPVKKAIEELRKTNLALTEELEQIKETMKTFTEIPRKAAMVEKAIMEKYPSADMDRIEKLIAKMDIDPLKYEDDVLVNKILSFLDDLEKVGALPQVKPKPPPTEVEGGGAPPKTPPKFKSTDEAIKYYMKEHRGKL